MRKTWLAATAAAVTVSLVVGCGAPDSPANEPGEGGVESDAIAPMTSMSEVMAGLVDHAAHAIWDLQEAGMAPESEQAWEEVQHNAIQLIASASYITYGNTGEMNANWVERTGWKSFSQDMADRANEIFNAAVRHDFDAVVAASDSLVETCETCHEEYKLTLPREGLTHRHLP